MRLLSSSLLYIVIGFFIVGWWILAFRTANPIPLTSPITPPESLALKTSQLLEELSPFQRDALQHALAGDFPLMLQLIDQWDQDAQLLLKKGFAHIHRLPPENYLKAHILGHLLQDSSPDALRHLNCKMNLKTIHDDSGRLLQIEDTFERFLPQTFVAASFLMAIAHPHEIVALPKGMRHLTQLYSPEKLALIPGNIDWTHSERLYLANPHLAFVAPYSHPPAIEVLRNQNIQLYTLHYDDSLDTIQEALLKIGHASNHILEAQLLAIFMEASFLSIDNRLEALHEKTKDLSQTPCQILYLYYHQQYMLPTSKCLSGQLMARAVKHCPHLSCSIPRSEQDWRIPYEQEKILKEEPDCLIISTPFYLKTQTVAHNLQPLQDSIAFKSQRIFYLDEAIQDSPTQYIVLAYFDIYQALSAAHCL